MEILYISALSSENLIHNIYSNTRENPGFAVQKFSRLLVKGILKNDAKCISLSVPPVTKSYSSKLWISFKNESENNVEYRYIPFINLSFLKHICVFLYSFFYVLIWGMKDRRNKVIICDVLSVSACMGALLASKCCGIKSVAVVTDIYDQMVGQKPAGIMGLISNLAGVLNRLYVKSFSSYVLLTEAMNELVNPKGKPYIVMEALCDADTAQDGAADKSYPRVAMYAGGLEEKYGLKMLVEAFKCLDLENVELHIYGSGSYVDELIDETKSDTRIKYWGIRPNAEILEAEKKATLLVNPRFTTESFTKYSFPSKNMEYMASGTPLLTTKLPGMPKEYDEYVFLFDEETIKGYAHVLNMVLSMPEEALVRKGLVARDFVLREKNHVVQARKIIKLIENGKSL